MAEPTAHCNAATVEAYKTSLPLLENIAGQATYTNVFYDLIDLFKKNIREIYTNKVWASELYGQGT